MGSSFWLQVRRQASRDCWIRAHRIGSRQKAGGVWLHYFVSLKEGKTICLVPFYSNVVELASKSNALVICRALTEQTHHLINKEVMLAHGKEGFLVNVGRGALIDENEMVRCLMEGEFGGAGLDVFENEPHVPKEVVALDKVVLLPHVSVFTSESQMALSNLVAGNLEAFFSNNPLITPVRDY
ncbi:glyoxylate/hydroxypyruvate reductase HPR3-like [Quillaja saponaria]|uniref:Glyoxylate/hydroxypyruvate reductase HPR3-like n=1 Tax=Quillaja saponaria TaxID=32244 RepID=A0AAD7L542_QUISA|nr:glyoxylate/hydroxypyruvate reductase HPR3-like [Quillaja saponaria]